MKKYVAALCLFCSSSIFSQVSGNIEYEKSYSDYSRTSTSKTYTSSQDRTYLSDTTILIPAAVIINTKADQFVAVWAVKEETKTISGCIERIDKRIGSFMQSLTAQGIRESDVDVDFISQRPIFDYAVSGNVAEEKLEGFEVQKNISIRFDKRKLFDSLVVLASRNDIYDLVKVDYYVSKSDEIRNQLFEEAVKIIHRKKDLYTQKLNVKLKPNAQIYAENYEIYFPSEMYNSYQAFESAAIKQRTGYSSKADTWIKEKRKSKTFFYNGMTIEGFDTVINPLILEPMVQFTLSLKVKYELVR